MKLGLKHKAYIVLALFMLADVASSMALGQSYFGAERSRVFDARRRGVDDAATFVEQLLTRGLDRLRTVAAFPALAYGLPLQEQGREARQIPAWTTLHYLFFESDVFTGGVVLVNRTGQIIWSEPSDISRLDTPYTAWPRVQTALARQPDADSAFIVERAQGAAEVLVAVALFDQQQERVAVSSARFRYRARPWRSRWRAACLRSGAQRISSMLAARSWRPRAPAQQVSVSPTGSPPTKRARVAS